MKVTYSTNAWGPVLAHWAAPNCVNAAYYRCDGDLGQALKDVSSAGFESVEIFDGDLLGFEGDSLKLAGMLKENSLKLKGVYIACNFIYDEILPEELDRVKRAASFARSLGATEIALGGGAIRFDGIRESDYVKLGEALNKVCEIAAELGMRASFHPHMGSLVESPEQLAKVLAHTDIKLCPDLAHVKLGGGDPLEIVKKYIDRIEYIHLKDVTADGMFCPLGVGTLNIKAILDVLTDALQPIDYAIECDGWSGDPAEGAKITAEFLKEYGF
ncbi:MAG: TIM barrel protein [Christensenellaceae bacterium]|nr:TIM barrel protein [Christensenellaceae bacterium]